MQMIDAQVEPAASTHAATQDPEERAEWIEALDGVISAEGPATRARDHRSADRARARRAAPTSRSR